MGYEIPTALMGIILILRGSSLKKKAITRVGYKHQTEQNSALKGSILIFRRDSQRHKLECEILFLIFKSPSLRHKKMKF